MPFPLPPWELGAGLFLLGLAGWVLYVRYLHPAWRKERRVIRACEKAFDEGDYMLVRLRTDPGGPSIGDLFPWPIGPSGTPRYFTYNVEAAEGEEPDFSGMSRKEISVVRHYLRRSVGQLPHHGREVLRPEWKEEPPFQSKRQEEAD